LNPIRPRTPHSDYEDEEEEEKKNMSREDRIPRSYPNRAGRERMFWWRRVMQKPVEKQRFGDSFAFGYA
jgi:hypothetical protein